MSLLGNFARKAGERVKAFSARAVDNAGSRLRGLVDKIENFPEDMRVAMEAMRREIEEQGLELLNDGTPHVTVVRKRENTTPSHQPHEP